MGMNVVLPVRRAVLQMSVAIGMLSVNSLNYLMKHTPTPQHESTELSNLLVTVQVRPGSIFSDYQIAYLEQSLLAPSVQHLIGTMNLLTKLRIVRRILCYV